MQETVAKGELVPGTENPADICTKRSDRVKHKEALRLLRMTYSLREFGFKVISLSRYLVIQIQWKFVYSLRHHRNLSLL
jgi:hypothetical protein